MNITEVRVKLTEAKKNRLQAFCSITIDNDFVVRDLKIIEGYKGAFVAMPSRKLADKCPKCNRKIGNLGKDYGELDNYYVCFTCNDKFPEPEYEFECRNCENKFEKHQATWIKNMNYKIIK